MKLSFLIRSILCVGILSFFLYLYLDKQNELTTMRIRIPEVAKRLKMLHEENVRLKYEIDQFENPGHLMQLARKNEYRHLKHPLVEEIVVLQEGKMIPDPIEQSLPAPVKPRPALALGAKQ